MIQINMLGDEALKALKLKLTIEKALKTMRERPFSGRNPELGKMINCKICSRRHRETQIMKSHPKFGGKQIVKCVQVFKKDELGSLYMTLDPTRHKGRGTRKNPHFSARRLELVQRTRQQFDENEPYFTNARECMEESRDMAARALKKERSLEKRNDRRTKTTSRRINAGLAVGGSRPPLSVAHTVSPATYQARRKKLDARTKVNAEARIANESH